MQTPTAPSSRLVTVVVPTADGFPLLEACLRALRTQTFEDFETIVVDNSSHDETAGLVLGRFPEVRLLELGENGGFCGAVNAGAAQARGRYIAILNNDAVPQLGWLAELVACAHRHPRAASVAPKVLRGADGVLDGAGDSVTRSFKAYRRGLGEPDEGQYDVEEEVFAASGTACLWRSDVFRELGGYDERFFAYYEDVDLAFRARHRGYECWYAPLAVVAHAGAGTSRRTWALFESFYAVRNRWLMIRKNVPPSWLARNAGHLLIGELATIFRACLRLELRAVARAYLELAGRTARPISSTEPRMSYGDFRAFAARRQPPLGMAWRRFRWTSSLRSDVPTKPRAT